MDEMENSESEGFAQWRSRKRLELACGSLHCPACEREGLENFFAFAAGQHGLEIDVGSLVDEYLISANVPGGTKIPDFVSQTVDRILCGSWRFVEGFQAFCRCRSGLLLAA